MSQLSASEMSNFKNTSLLIMKELSLKALALPPNTAQVWPGGATFTTIQAAIDSITGAGPQEQYQVAVGPGTYSENITMKDYIYISGAGADKTVITAAGQQQYRGTVNTGANSGISHLSIQATGGSWGTIPCALLITGAEKFHASGVTITASDEGNMGNNVRGVSNNTGATSANIILGQCIINAIATGQSSTPIAVEGFDDGFSYFIELSTISSQGSGMGITTAARATVKLMQSTVTGQYWALYDSDQISLITAQQCTINGPISTGVIVQ
jgi:hypothetical protein